MRCLGICFAASPIISKFLITASAVLVSLTNSSKGDPFVTGPYLSGFLKNMSSTSWLRGAYKVLTYDQKLFDSGRFKKGDF